MMKKKNNLRIKLIFFIIFVAIFSLPGCSEKNISETIPSTIQNTDLPTITFTVEPSPTSSITPSLTPLPTKTKTPFPTPTLEPQIFGSIFPENYLGQGIWSNADGDGMVNGINQDGWVNIEPNFYGIHFDVESGTNYNGEFLIAPVDAVIHQIYSIGDEGWVIKFQIVDHNIAGLENLVNLSENEYNYLSHGGEIPFDYSLRDIKNIFFHFGHVDNPALYGIHEYQKVEKGIELVPLYGEAIYHEIVAYVIELEMKDGKTFHFSPCMVENTAAFCNNCYPGSPYRCKSFE